MSVPLRRWSLNLARRGTSHQDLQDSLDSGEPPTGFRVLGNAELQVCERCEGRLLWLYFRDQANQRQRPWWGLLGVAGVSAALGHYFGSVGFMLGPPLVALLAAGWFLHGWLRRDPEVTKSLLLARHRRSLAVQYHVPPKRLMLVAESAA